MDLFPRFRAIFHWENRPESSIHAYVML
jgi:hypothetical protein